MEAWMAFVSIVAIIAIVLIAGGIIAFLGHMIIGVFDKDRSADNTKNQTLEYSQYKLENSNSDEKEYDFSSINLAKAEKERDAANNEDKNDDELFKLLDADTTSDDEIKQIEERLKNSAETEAVDDKQTESADQADETEEEEDKDLNDLLDEISTGVVDEEKERINEEASSSTNETLAKYNIDDILNDINQEEEETVDVEEDNEDEASEEETEENNITSNNSEELEKANQEIEELRAQLADMNKKLDEARTEKREVSIDMTEEECLNRLATLEDRLKEAKKDYKINMKEYRPLQRVMKQYEKYLRKLRKKDMQLANKKISLYGVNNYVDLDKEKAENVLNESELVEGLRLSVSHCEEVINANKDRYPILEHTNSILENQIANLEADIESTKQILEKIREKKGSEEGSSEQNN